METDEEVGLETLELEGGASKVLLEKDEELIVDELDGELELLRMDEEVAVVGTSLPELDGEELELIVEDAAAGMLLAELDGPVEIAVEVDEDEMDAEVGFETVELDRDPRELLLLAGVDVVDPLLPELELVGE